MIVLVLNCGSSSIKYKLYNMDDESVLAQGGAERIGLDNAFVKVTLKDGSKEKVMHDMPDHKEGVKFVFSLLLDPKYGALKSLDQIDAVGHRIVQGGDLFEKSCIVTKEVEDGIESLCDLAPVHNAGHLRGIRAVDALMPHTPQVTVFDNAFHSTMPAYAYLYAVPYELYEKYHVRRYGFHGTSHRYVSRRACEILGVPYEEQRIITAHVGNGGSIAAVDHGKCVDTSMGLTPTEGLLMGTRCGDVDAGALAFLIDKEGLDAAGMSNLINKQSGVAGLSGVSSDMREIEKAFEEGNERAKLAFDMYFYRIRKYIGAYAAAAAGNPRAIMALNVYNYRIKKYIGAYAAAMGGCDILVWTGGVGENQWETRRVVCQGMEYMGMKIDVEKNHGMRGEEMVISTPDSKVTIIVVPTDEEFMIASDTADILMK